MNLDTMAMLDRVQIQEADVEIQRIVAELYQEDKMTIDARIAEIQKKLNRPLAQHVSDGRLLELIAELKHLYQMIYLTNKGRNSHD